MHARTVALLLAVTLAGCDRSVDVPPQAQDQPDRAEEQEGNRMAAAAVDAARIDSLDARISALENDSARSEDKAQDARLDAMDAELDSLRQIAAPTAPVAVSPAITTKSGKIARGAVVLPSPDAH